jgi:hypothetical protein
MLAYIARASRISLARSSSDFGTNRTTSPTLLSCGKKSALWILHSTIQKQLSCLMWVPYRRRKPAAAITLPRTAGSNDQPIPPPRWLPAKPHIDRCTIVLPAFIAASGRHQSQREIPMRILALAILTIATASAAPSARAQTYDPAYPVCLQVYQGMTDFYFECSYTSLAQCNASASGRAAQCIVNPYYAGPKKAPPGRKHRRHH